MDGQQGMDGYRQPVESTRDPRTYHCMDSRHGTCGVYRRPMDIQLYGQPTRDLWTQPSCLLGLGTCHHVGQRGNQGWEI